MCKVDAGQLPNELVGIDSSVKVAALNGINGQGPQQRSPLRVQLSDAVADDTAFCIIQLEDRGRDGATAAQAGACRPAQPFGKQGAQAGQSLLGLHRGSHDVSVGKLRGFFKEFNLELFLGAEMSEQAAFGHLGVGSEAAEREAGQAFGTQRVETERQ